MGSPIPPINANARTSLEIEDSCNCASNCCWGSKKTKHRKKPTVETRVDEVAVKAMPKK